MMTKQIWTAMLIALLGVANAQERSLPPPEATDPVSLKLMQGFPPPLDRSVRLGTILKYPNARWAFHHMRELGPTAPIRRGAGPVSTLPSTPSQLGAVHFETAENKSISIDDWLRTTYTDSVLVLHRGQIVYERYFAGMAPEDTHALWSMSKSLVGLLVTQLVQEGTLDTTALISQYIPELKDSAWGDATLQQTLDMVTGAKYSENFADPMSGLFRYLVAGGLIPEPATYSGPRSVLEFLPTVPKEGTHGDVFSYKSVDSEVLGWVLQRVTGRTLAQLISERLWMPLGAQEDGYVWTDPSGMQVASVGVGATLRDLGRLGEMLRNAGRFGGRQVLSADVVVALRKGGDPQRFRAAVGQAARAGYSYHNQFWIAHDADKTFEAKGLHGQHLHVNPAAELVIVKFSSHPVPNTAFTHVLDRRAFAAIASAVRQNEKTRR